MTLQLNVDTGQMEDFDEVLPDETDLDPEEIERSIRDAERRMENMIHDLAFGIEANAQEAVRVAQFAAAEAMTEASLVRPPEVDDEENIDRESYVTRDGDWAHPDSQHKADQTKSIEQQYYNESGANKYADELRLFEFKTPTPQDCATLKYAADADKVKVLLRVIDDVTNKPTLRYHKIEKKKVVLDVEWDASYGKLVKKFTELLVLCPDDDSEATDIVQFVECP